LLHYLSYVFKINKVEKIIIELNNSQVMVYTDVSWIQGGSPRMPPPEGSSAGKFILNRGSDIQADIDCHILYHVSNLGACIIFSMKELIEKTKEVDPFVKTNISNDPSNVISNDKSYIFLDLD